jgi:hypothetical protein
MNYPTGNVIVRSRVNTFRSSNASGDEAIFPLMAVLAFSFVLIQRNSQRSGCSKKNISAFVVVFKGANEIAWLSSGET